MSAVFIGGSRRVAKVSAEIARRLDNIITSKIRVLVGDASGFDKAAQDYLAARGYPNVLVYCSGGVCRNNMGGWDLKSIDASGKKRGFDFYTAKDDAMLADADYGLFAWDGKSRGTLRNVVNMASRGKPSAVYLACENAFVTVRNRDDADRLSTHQRIGSGVAGDLFVDAPRDLRAAG